MAKIIKAKAAAKTAKKSGASGTRVPKNAVAKKAVAKKAVAKATAKKPTNAKSAKLAKAVKKVVKVSKVVQSKSASKVAKKVVKKVVKKAVALKNKKPAKATAKSKVMAKSLPKSKVVKPTAKKVKPVPKAAAAKVTKAPKATKATKPVSPAASKSVKVTSKVTAKVKQVVAPQGKAKANAEIKFENAVKAAKSKKVEIVEKIEPVSKGAKGSIAPMAASVAIVPGKSGRATAAMAAPVAPIVTVLAPVRALPKSMTVKAVVTNVLPFNPNTKRVGGLLSEAEILKQGKNDYMSKQQLAFFRQRLTDLQAQLRENAGQTTEHLRELSIVPDPADRATLEEEHALELRARDRERKLLKKVEAAIVRIDDGSYGYCEETGDPIGVPRLLARPTATLTIEAQERRELKQRMFGE